jgi:hypothetical protein
VDCLWSIRKLPAPEPGYFSLEVTLLKVREGECEDGKTFRVHLSISTGAMEWEGGQKDAGAARIDKALIALSGATEKGKHMLPKGKVGEAARVNGKNLPGLLEAMENGRLVKVYVNIEDAREAGWTGSGEATVVHLTHRGLDRALAAKRAADEESDTSVVRACPSRPSPQPGRPTSEDGRTGRTHVYGPSSSCPTLADDAAEGDAVVGPSSELVPSSAYASPAESNGVAGAAITPGTAQTRSPPPSPEQQAEEEEAAPAAVLATEPVTTTEPEAAVLEAVHDHAAPTSETGPVHGSTDVDSGEAQAVVPIFLFQAKAFVAKRYGARAGEVDITGLPNGWVRIAIRDGRGQWDGPTLEAALLRAGVSPEDVATLGRGDAA